MIPFSKIRFFPLLPLLLPKRMKKSEFRLSRTSLIKQCNYFKIGMKLGQVKRSEMR
jgi:hypothetical protein